jgi:hypothetical protein
MADQDSQPRGPDPVGDLDESPVPDSEAKDTDAEDVPEAD